MSMNIGPALRALMGEGQPADGRSLELRIGQIVRGVLLEMLNGQEGLININGMQVRAKLEAEMPLGHSMLLQVQPASAGGNLTLKPLADATETLPDEGMKDLLKSFGLPEQKWGMELVRGLKRDGFPIGKDMAGHFNAAMNLKPATVDAQTWMGAADVAFRRGLEPTEATLMSLRQALFQAPLHESLSALRTATANWLAGANNSSPETVALGQKVQALLAQGAALLQDGEAQLAGAAPKNGGAPAAAAAAHDAAAANAPGPAGTPPAAGAGPAAPQPAQMQAAPAQAQRQEPGAPAAAPEHERGAATGRAATTAADAARAAGTAGAAGQAPPAPKQEAAWLGRFLQWLGASHEHKLMHAAEPQRLPGDAGLPAGGAAAAPGADAPAPASAQETRPAAETLKGALLALAAHEGAPPALREAAGTLANQITGQQLLLATERNNTAPFSHMTLFVPMKNGDGQTTATVHVQTRRSRRGEWDTDNCRLLFDLRMRNLGDTVVDVQVVDRIVSLKLLSDYPGMAELLEVARGELEAGMSSAGFQLFSLTAAPLPEWKGGSGASGAGVGDADKALPAGAFASKPYKGVDFRV